MQSILPEIAGFYEDCNTQVSTNIWTEHKNKIQALFDDSISYLNEKKKQALIFGAGNCNDLNLSQIVNSFDDKTYLIDIDKKSLDYAISKESYEIKEKLEIVKEDITGLYMNDDFKKFKKACLTKNERSALKIIKKWNSQDSLCSRDVIKEAFQLIISSTISTQFASPISLFINNVYPTFNLKVAILSLGETLAQKHVIQISDLLEEGGIAVIVSEQSEWGTVEQVNLPTMKYIQKPEMMLDKQIQDKIDRCNDYLLGRITKDHLSKANFKILKNEEWIWNFTGNRHYWVKGWIVQKN